MALEYDLAQVFADQDPDHVRCLIAPTLVRLCEKEVPEAGIATFPLEMTSSSAAAHDETLSLSWSLRSLRPLVSNLDDDIRALLTNKSPQTEDTTKLAAYGMATCAICVLLPGRKIIEYRQWGPPDILFSDLRTEPSFGGPVVVEGFRGVEVAGRKAGGRPILLRIAAGNRHAQSPRDRKGKRRQLLEDDEIEEVYLSLWSFRSKRYTMWERVK